MPDFKRGLQAMNEALETQKAGGTAFSPFVRAIQWREDGEEKYITFLNHGEDITTVNLHSFVPVSKGTSKSGKAYTRYEEFIDRTDPSCGEANDDLTDRLGHKAQLRTIAVGVELEPTFTQVGGRKRPTGFEVKTETYERKTDDGGTEEVVAPCVGMIVQSPNNFFSWVGSFNESTAPIEGTAFSVKRQGKDKDTQYNMVPYLDQPIDYSNLFENVSGVAYIREEVKDLDLSGDPVEASCAIGDIMLMKRLNELADGERYTKMVDPIQEIISPFGNNTPAPARKSQRVATAPSAAAPTSPQFDKLRKMHEAKPTA